MSAAANRPEHDPWLGVEVRHLAALRAVAEEGTFGAAALKLGYAQSAISQQVAALERHVGHLLFDRPGGPRPVTLTRAGELLLEHAESILTRLSAARADLDSLDAEEVSTPLRIGAYTTVAAAILPGILAELGADLGDGVFTLTESGDDRELLSLLELGDLDVAFTETLDPGGTLEAEALIDDPYVLIAPADHPLAAGGIPITLEQMADVPLVVFRGGTGARRIEEAFALHALVPRIAHRVDDPATLQAFVARGLGLALVPRLACDLAGKDDLVALPVEQRLPPRTIAVAWHRERLRTCTAGLFVDLAIEAAAQLREAPA